jgi:ABC-type antimicrobial peptide transport system permease subunit
LLISAIGLYSALAYTVTQRRLELGIRSALGAQVGDVVRLVMRQGIRAAAVGVIVGLATALVAGRFVADLLFETSPRNPIVLGAVATLLLAVSAIASFIPAWRASHVDPATALRAD